MPEPEPRAGLAALARPSGVFAMLALDQRESLRTMFDTAKARPTDDATLTAFKVDAARALTPHASAVLLDVALGLEPVRDAAAIAPGCGLIVAADRLVQAPGGPVEDTAVDEDVFADERATAGADAFKLLVIWRPDRDRDRREATVRRFVEACRTLRRPSIVEGIVRPADAAPPFDPARHAEAVLAAAAELTAPGPDLYKAEVPTHGRGDDGPVVDASRELSAIVARPWVVLSNGVAPERFPSAALAAARGGASGFLAGRAIWSASVAAVDSVADLRTSAAARLRELGVAMDPVATPWTAVEGARS